MDEQATLAAAVAATSVSPAEPARPPRLVLDGVSKRWGRNLVVGTSVDSTWRAIGRLALFAAVLLPPSVLFVRACLRSGQRRGSVLEY